ncbi:recombinase family protein [Herminiimonas glaciei]|uniref:Recombinase family protein n=1 Tax=Herminiimonas glaciei TaxID=523788 RepID=A0ABW2I625_9BURK
MQQGAFYGRYSTDEQKPTSIEDQLRRAREFAQKIGISIPDNLVFADEATTGSAKGLAKRAGYKRLLAAWEKKEFDVLIVDELCRLARDPIELATIQVRIEKTKIRLICADGLDTSKSGWQLQFGFSSVMAAHFVRETGHRVTRAMIGQLERGFMIAAPPFGYNSVRETEEGTLWEIDKEKANYVRDIYERRFKGASFATIARHLNEEGLPTPRKPRLSQISYWRPATVRQMLQNTIYRGLFVWNGSAFSKAKEKRGETTLEPKPYPRPNLRIVDDDIWFACNKPMSGWRTPRGGDKHVFAGLVSCGTCDANLTVSTGGSVKSLYCAQCAQAKKLGVPNRVGNYVSTNGVQEVLIQALEKMFSDDAKSAFREELRNRLEGGQELRIKMLKEAVQQKERQASRLVRLLSSAETEDKVVEDEYKQVLAERRRLSEELAQAETLWSNTDAQSIERQLKIDPLILIPKLFSGDAPAEKVRAALRRLFPKIVLLGKPSHYCSEFKIDIAPGVALADWSKTNVMYDGTTTLYYRVTTGAKRPSIWQIEEIKGIN